MLYKCFLFVIQMLPVCCLQQLFCSLIGSLSFPRVWEEVNLHGCLLMAISGACATGAPTFLIYCLACFLKGACVLPIYTSSVFLSKSEILQILFKVLIDVNVLPNLGRNQDLFFFLSVIEWTSPKLKTLVTTLTLCAQTLDSY